MLRWEKDGEFGSPCWVGYFATQPLYLIESSRDLKGAYKVWLMTSRSLVRTALALRTTVAECKRAAAAHFEEELLPQLVKVVVRFSGGVAEVADDPAPVTLRIWSEDKAAT